MLTCKQDPRYAARFEAQLKTLKDNFANLESIIHATIGVLEDTEVQGRSMQFMRYVIVWLLRLASGQNLPKEQLRLPLASEPPVVFKCLPQYFIEDIVDNFKFITRHMPQIITTTQCEEIITICIAFLTDTQYIQSPYAKAGLVTILCSGVWPFRGSPKGVLGDVLNGSSFAHKHLLHALMNFYIQAESTGTHSQFYDKFNIRFEIFAVFKCIWSNTLYRERLAIEASYVECLSGSTLIMLTKSQGQHRVLRPLRQLATQRRHVCPRRALQLIHQDPRAPTGVQAHTTRDHGRRGAERKGRAPS